MSDPDRDRVCTDITNLSLQIVHGADKICDKVITGKIIKLGWCTDLLNDAMIENSHAISGCHRFFLVVRDKNCCNAKSAL